HTGQDTTTPALDPDTTPIPAQDNPTWPTSNAPTAQPQAPARLPSSYVNSYGALPDGTVGLVYAEPFSDEVVDGLHGQVHEALGLDPDDPPESVRDQVRDALSRENLALHLPYLRSNGGHRITVRVDGRDHTVDVQLTLSEARTSLRQGRFDQRDPDKHVERRGFGTRENFSSQPSGTYRTFQVPWTGSWPIAAPTAVRAVDGSLTVAITHNQASDATTVTHAVQTTSAQRSNESSDAVEFTTRWRVRVDAPAVTPPAPAATAPVPDGWGAPESHGRTTIWFPRHLTTADPAPNSLPAPARPADLPLYGVDSVIDPRALYEHVHQTFHADLDTVAAGQVSDFLSEQVLRGTLPMQIDGGIYSPVLTDASGNAVGMLHLVTVPTVGTPQRQSTPGKINLESHLVNTAKVDLSSKYTSGIGVSGSGAAALTGDHAQGHPDASGTVGGSLGLRGQTQATVTNTYSASSSAGTMHAIRTNRSHLLTPSGVTYRVTLIRPDGVETQAPALTLAHGMDLRVLSRTDAVGHQPSAAELRELPDALERLDAIGLSTAPLDVTGTDALFTEAEAWLRREGFLPPAAPGPTGIVPRLQRAARNMEPEHQIRLHAQLNNLRRLREARSRSGLRAATDAMVDGGHALHFEVPNSTDTGVRRVRLLLTAVRDTATPSSHLRVLPGIQVMGLAQMAGSDSEQRGESYGGALGPMGSVSAPLGRWGSIGFGADYQYGHQVTHGDTVGGATGHDQFFIATGQDSHEFEVPVRLALDLYAGEDDRPTERFGQHVNQALAPVPAPVVAPTTAGAPPGAVPPPVVVPPTVTGSLRLAVPAGRTHAPTVPAASPAARADGAPRLPDAADRARLDATDAHGVPRPELVRIPDDALIDTVRGAAAVESAFQRAAAQIRRDAQPTPTATATGTGTGPILPVTAPGVPPVPPATGAAPARDGVSPLAGHGLTDSRTRAAETRHAAITPGSLVANGHQIFKNSYVVEGLSLPGTIADGQYSLEIQAVAHRPRLLDSTAQYLETGVSATDSAQQLKPLGKSHQFGGSGVLTQNPPTRPSGPENAAGQGDTGPESDGSVSTSQSSGKPYKGLFNPSARLGRVSRTDTADTLAASTGVNRTPTESGTLHRVVADVTYLVTVRAGSRTLLNGVRDSGTIDPVTFAVDVPDGLQFLLTQGQLTRDARWMGAVTGLAPTPVPATAPLPASYIRTRELGLGGVLSVIEYDTPVAAPVPATGAVPLGPVSPRERRGRIRRELMDLVETEAPGAFTPGHSGYQPGVHSRIAQLTSTAGLRSLPGRGPDGTPRRATTRFHFRHHGFGGERLVEITLTAVPRRTQNLAAVRGSSTPGSGLEQWQSHTAAGRTTTRASVRQRQLPVTLTTRYLRPNQGPDPTRTDRAAPVFTPQSATSRSARRATTADNRFWLRTDNGADFDGLQYDYVLSVRSALVADWPPNVLGGLVQNGVIAWAGANGDVRRWMDELLARGTPRTRTVPVRLTLRFTGTETGAPVTAATVTAPSVVSGADPRNTVLPGTPPVPYLTDAQMFHPVGPTPAFAFDGWAHLETALNEVAPRGGRGWHAQITSVSVEGQAVRLGQLIQAGRVTLDRPRLAADLTRRMPGTAPFEGAPAQSPSIAVTLYNPRRSTHADDVTLDQLHNTTDTVSTAAGADHSLATGFTELLSGDDKNHQFGGLSVPLAQRQTQPSGFGGTTTGSRRDWLKSGSTSAPADGARGTRSYVIDTDAHLLVEGPEGTRHVTGTVTLRVEERDLLGHGLITPAESPTDVHDLPALVPDWATAAPHTLPERLNSAIPAGSHGVQFWVALGADPQGTHLGQALYGASRAAVLGNRPLELMTRDPQGVRRWEFTPEGALVTADPDLTTAWTAFHTQAELLHAATDTLTDTPQRLNRLTLSLQHANRSHTDATGAHQRARHAVMVAGTAHTRAIATSTASAEAARAAEAKVVRMKQDLANARRTVTTLPAEIARHERDETQGQRDLRTALARLTRAEDTVRAERASAQQVAQGGQSTAAPAPAPAPSAPGTRRSNRPAAEVADDPRVQAMVPAIIAAEDAVQQANRQLVVARARLKDAQRIVRLGPDRVREEEENHEEAVEQAKRDARAVTRRAENLRVATFRETRAGRRATRALAEVTRRNGQLATTVTAQLHAAADQLSATTALPGLSTAVRDSAPTPEQALRTTFATTPPRWPDPDGRATPLPAGAQTHTPPPAATTGTNPATSTPTPKQPPKKQPPKKTGPATPGTSSGKNDKGKNPAGAKSTAVDKGKAPLAPPPGTTTTATAPPPAVPPSPYVTPTGTAVPTPGDGFCLLYAVIGSAPELVRARLRQGATAFDAGTDGWLRQPHLVRQTLTALARNPATADQGTGHLRATRRGLQNLVLTRLAAARDGSRPLPPQVLGQLRGVLVRRFGMVVQGMPSAVVDSQLALYGIQGVTRAEDLDPVDLQTRYLQAVSAPGAPPGPAGSPPSNRRMFAYLRAVNALPTLATMTLDERRALLIAGYHQSTAALTAPEATELERVVRNWSDEWANRIGDTFLPLLADTLGVPIHVFQPVAPALAGTTATGGPRGIVLPYGPTTNTPALEVHYTGRNHYSASDAGPLTTPAVITPSSAPRGPGDGNSFLPSGR
ncbi:OTU domain-containing protein, partial [Streptomyces sp. NPDC048385]|uniref:OTU domain-containing protein n=3 Tax=Streptomyces TaxID=1883 RepID=UPI0034262C32